MYRFFNYYFLRPTIYILHSMSIWSGSLLELHRQTGKKLAIRIIPSCLYNLYNKFKVQLVWLFFLVQVKHFDMRDFSTSFGTVTWTISNNIYFILSPSDEFHFFGLSADAAYFKADFLQEKMVRIINIFASFTCLRHNNKDPDKVLWNLKTWIIKHFNKLILHTRFISKINFYREYGGLFLPTGVTSYVHWWDDEKVKEYIQAGVIFLSPVQQLSPLLKEIEILQTCSPCKDG